MPRRKTTFAEGEHYHIFNRGALRSTLFFTPNSYWLFIRLLNFYASAFNVEVIAVCMMPNHFHLLIRVGEGGDVPEMMKRIAQSYAKRINLALRRIGTVFESRYKSKHVDSEDYFMELLRYIHANPVKDGFVTHPSMWEYSTYHEHVGARHAIECISTPVTDRFATTHAFDLFVQSVRLDGKSHNTDLTATLAELRLL